MNSPKTLVIALLALTTLGGAALAWKQYAELVELRAAAMNTDERAELQKRLWDLEKANRELADRLAAARGEELEGLVATATNERPAGDRRGRGERGGDRGGPGGRGNSNNDRQANALRDLMSKPEVQALLSSQQKAAIEQRYAALFKNLNLNPEQADKLKTLLAERQTTRLDVMEAARSQGLNPGDNPEAFRKMMADARNQVESGIKSVLGDTGYQQLQTYEQTMPQRNLVNELQQRLSFSNTPLTVSQADQLVNILAANAPQRQTATTATPGQPQPGGDRGPGGGGFDRGGFGGGRGPDIGGLLGAIGGGGFGDLGRGGSAPITTAAVNQAQAVLSQPQVTALQQLQQQQQAQQQIQQLVRDTIASTTPQNTKKSGPTTGTATPTTGSTQPTRKRGGGGGGD